ncbi:MAG TPA: glucose-6-phosphate isomerase [Burkholderiales bacterium]
MNTTPPTECRAWSQLAHHAESWRGVRLGELFAHDAARAQQFCAEAAGVRLDYSRQRLGAVTLRLLSRLLEERGFAEWRAALLAGKPVNSSEKRAAWHTALRAGKDAPAAVKDSLLHVKNLCEKIKGNFKRVINLGTGGSDLGPRLLADAFGDGRLDVRFVANVDRLELERALAGAEPAATLFVVVSKSFTTAETLANAAAAKQWGGRHFIAVTANAGAAQRFGVEEVLPLWDWVGGRYSVWSAVGFAACCAMGFEKFDGFLSGAKEIDAHFSNAAIEKNLPALMALIGVWNANFLGAATHAVLPYAHALRLLPAYLQQLEMESNGKRIDREGREVGYATAPVVWGMEGTVSQHAFHQLLHQGTQAVPCDFIDFNIEKILSANATAQADALAFGSEDGQYPGNRPSSIIAIDQLTPKALGRLLALYEHKVFTQGVIWNLNSFDQPGVELGKRLAANILKGDA